MDETDTATIELTKGEARELINALSDYRLETSGREEERVLNLRELLQREFGFDEGRFEDDGNVVEMLSGVFDDSDTHEVELSKSEAGEVDDALAAFEPESTPDETETVESLRERFAETYDLDDRRSS